MKRLFLAFCLLLSCATMVAQKLEVKDFHKDELSAEARTKAVVDPNTKRNCALLIIKGNDIRNYTFSGHIIGKPEYSVGEVRLYMAPGSNEIAIRSENSGNINYRFGDVLESQVVYTMTLYYNQEKTRTLIMPVAGLGKTTSFGAMIGIVKKYGGYVKAKYNLKSLSTDLEVNEKGFTPTGNEVWFSGNKDQSRLAITGGALVRVAQPAYLYVGLGFGDYTYAWETTDKKWAKNSASSVSGVEIEAGAIANFKSFAISAGIETCQFKYWELNVGIGVFIP